MKQKSNSELIRTLFLNNFFKRIELSKQVFEINKKLGKYKDDINERKIVEKIHRQVCSIIRDIKTKRKGWWKKYQIVTKDDTYNSEVKLIKNIQFKNNFIPMEDL